MAFDSDQLEQSFRFDANAIAALRRTWGQLLDQAVWGELKTRQIGAVPRLRKRLLDIGENLRSLVADRRWIPHERERVKGAMAASLNLRDALQQADRVVSQLDGGADFPSFEPDYLAFRKDLLVVIETHEQLWGDLLESLYADDDGANDESDDVANDDTPANRGQDTSA